MKNTVYFRIKKFPGTGWGLEKLTRAENGKILNREDVAESECSRSYTMHQAVMVADSENRSKGLS